MNYSLHKNVKCGHMPDISFHCSLLTVPLRFPPTLWIQLSKPYFSPFSMQSSIAEVRDRDFSTMVGFAKIILVVPVFIPFCENLYILAAQSCSNTGESLGSDTNRIGTSQMRRLDPLIMSHLRCLQTWFQVYSISYVLCRSFGMHNCLYIGGPDTAEFESVWKIMKK